MRKKIAQRRISKMKILVTGGAGFIGSNVVDGYIENGHSVVVADNLFSGKRENINSDAIFYEVDIRSQEIATIIANERPEVINHHAAQISVPASVEDPCFDADVNVKGFLNILEASRKNGVRKIVFISSGGAIYGEAGQYPTSETYSPRPLSPYAITKLASEYYLSYYYHQWGLAYTVLRYANIYGPRQIPHGEAGVVAIFMTHLMKNQLCTLYHFPNEPSGMIRDYCFVGDVVKANLLALDHGENDIFNIGNQKGTNTLDLFHIVFEEVKKVKIDLADNLQKPKRKLARPGDITQSCLVAEKAKSVLGWRPETSLEEGIRATLEWYQGRRK
jgi:UDP-glucose 4-epimerase